MPCVLIFVRDNDLKKRFDLLEARTEIENFFLGELAQEDSLQVKEADDLAFDWIYPKYSRASADIMIWIPYQVRRNGLVPMEAGDPTFTKEEAARLLALLKERFFPNNTVGPWLTPLPNAGYAEG